MRLLILGGSRFVGPAVVEAAHDRGWVVTTFNRGISGPDPGGVEVVRGDRRDPDAVARLVARGPWDAAVDLSGYVPRETLALCRSLEPVVAHYVFVSTVSVYEGWPSVPLTESSKLLSCPADAGPGFGEDVEDGPTVYGYQKSGCESAVALAFGAERSVSLRSGVVLGPREYVGRLPWWLCRIAAGGRVLAPGRPATRTIQPIDVRDLAGFAAKVASRRVPGAFNVTAPLDDASMGDLLGAFSP